MYAKRYWMAADCPNCGDKDSEGAWRGARMTSSRWGHDYACCSDKCGMEFANSPKRKAMDRADLQHKIEAMQQRLRELEA